MKLKYIHNFSGQIQNRKMRTVIYVYVILILVFSLGFGQNISNIPGAFVDVGYGVRPMGMGGAFTAVSDDPNTAYWNPAGLLKVKYSGISLMYTKQMNLIPYYFSTFQMKITDDQAVGAALMYNGDDVYSEFSFSGAYSYHAGQFFPDPFKKLYVGGAIKYRHAGFGNNPDGGIGQISGSANGFGIDLGALWEILPGYSVAITWKDFSDMLNWNSRADDLNYSNSYNEDIPASLTIGMAVKSSKKMTLALDFKKSLRLDTHDRIAFGVEKEIFHFLIPRFGVSQNLFAATDELNRHLNAGLGIKTEFPESNIAVAFNFAYQFTDINPTLRFGIDMSWGVVRKKPLPPRAAIIAVPDTINEGEDCKLKWLVKGGTFITIEPDIGRVDSLGMLVIKPPHSKKYKLKAIGPGGSSTYSTAVTVLREIPPPEIDLQVVPDKIAPGEEAKIIWNSSNALKINLETFGEVELSGFRTVKPQKNVSYIFKVTGAGGELTKAVEIHVKERAKQIQDKYILSGINFNSGSATISAASFNILDEVVESLRAWSDVRIEIRGYTDSSGNKYSNLKLSQKRAESVRDYFIGKGISFHRLNAKGFGDENPVASNKTKEGRAQNRRIEIVRTN